MKKEHWLYIIIAILAIWVIVSYASAPKTEAPMTTNESVQENVGMTTESQPGAGTSDGADVDLSAESGAVVSSKGVMEVGSPAGPNKGVLVSATAPVTGSVVVANQSAGNLVKINKVDMPINGWVVVHEELGGAPGNILGAQRFDAGSYSGGQVELMRGMVVGGRYYAMIHMDNGDKIFDKTTDVAYMQGGTVISVSFSAE